MHVLSLLVEHFLWTASANSITHRWSYTRPALSRCSCIGPRAVWCLCRLFAFARYSLRSRIVERAYKSHCQPKTISSKRTMNFLISSNVIKRAQFSCKHDVCALNHVLVFEDGTVLWVVAFVTAVDLSLPQTRCVVIHLSMNKSRRLSAVFDGSSANVPFFSSQKIIWIWKVVGWLRVICILAKVCSFDSCQIFT